MNMDTEDPFDIKHLEVLSEYKDNPVVDTVYFGLDRRLCVSDEVFYKAYKCVVLRLLLCAKSVDLPFSKRYSTYHKLLVDQFNAIIKVNMTLCNKVEELEKEVKSLKSKINEKGNENEE